MGDIGLILVSWCASADYHFSFFMLYFYKNLHELFCFKMKHSLLKMKLFKSDISCQFTLENQRNTGLKISLTSPSLIRAFVWYSIGDWWWIENLTNLSSFSASEILTSLNPNKQTTKQPMATFSPMVSPPFGLGRCQITPPGPAMVMVSERTRVGK